MSEFRGAVGGGCIGVADGLWMSLGDGGGGNKGGTNVGIGGVT